MFFSSKKYPTKCISGLVLLFLMADFVIGGVLLPYNEAKAGFPTTDISNLIANAANLAMKAVDTIKNAAFDLWKVIEPRLEKVSKAIFAILKKKILDLLVDDIVTWIQGGGTPQFITDWQAFAEKVVDQAGGEFVDRVLGLGVLCNRFSAQLRVMLTKPKTFNTVKCTLSQIGRNIENFFDNFDNGGWTSWISLSESQNNLYGAYLTIADQRLAAESAAARAAQNEGIASSGFLGDRVCTVKQCPVTGMERFVGAGGWKESELGQCACTNWQIRTPGRMAADAISRAVVDVPILSVLNANEYSEYLGAITDAAINRALKEGFLYIKTNAAKRGTVVNDLARTAQAVGSLLNPFCTVQRLGALLKPILKALKGATSILRRILGALRGVAKGVRSLRDFIGFLPGMLEELTKLITFARCDENAAPGLPATVTGGTTAIYERNKDLSVTLADKLNFLQEALEDYRAEINLSLSIAEDIEELQISSARSLNDITDKRCLLPTDVTKTSQTTRTENCAVACPCAKTTQKTTVFKVTVEVDGQKETLEAITVKEKTIRTMGKLVNGNCSNVSTTLPEGSTPPCIPCDPICEYSTETTEEVTVTGQEVSAASLRTALQETNEKLTDIEDSITLVTDCAIAAADYLSSNPGGAQLSEEQLEELKPILEALGLANDAFSALIPTIDQIIDDTVQKILDLRNGRGREDEICDSTTFPFIWDVEKDDLYTDLCNAQKLDERFSLYRDACPCVTYYDGHPTAALCSQTGNYCFDSAGKTSITCPQCLDVNYIFGVSNPKWPKWPDNFYNLGVSSLSDFRDTYQTQICTNGCYDATGQQMSCPATCSDAWGDFCTNGCYGDNNQPISCTDIIGCFATKSCPDGCYAADNKPIPCPATENKCFNATTGERMICPTCGKNEQGAAIRCPDGCYDPTPCPLGCYVGDRKIPNDQGVRVLCGNECYTGVGFLKKPCPANVSY